MSENLGFLFDSLVDARSGDLERLVRALQRRLLNARSDLEEEAEWFLPRRQYHWHQACPPWPLGRER